MEFPPWIYERLFFKKQPFIECNYKSVSSINANTFFVICSTLEFNNTVN